MKNALRISILTAIAATLALPALATAKGPESARLSGPGIKGAIALRGNGENGAGPLGVLTLEGGFFPLVFGQSPDPTLRSRPQGDLGAPFTVRFRVPGGNGPAGKIVETIYPYAPGGPVVYMKPLQDVWYGQTTYGGWFRAPLSVKTALVRAGLPASPPVGGSGFWWSPGAYATVSAGALLALLLVVGAVIGLRRRHGPVPAH